MTEDAFFWWCGWWYFHSPVSLTVRSFAEGSGNTEGGTVGYSDGGNATGFGCGGGGSHSKGLLHKPPPGTRPAALPHCCCSPSARLSRARQRVVSSSVQGALAAPEALEAAVAVRAPSQQQQFCPPLAAGWHTPDSSSAN